MPCRIPVVPFLSSTCVQVYPVIKTRCMAILSRFDIFPIGHHLPQRFCCDRICKGTSNCCGHECHLSTVGECGGLPPQPSAVLLFGTPHREGAVPHSFHDSFSKPAHIVSVSLGLCHIFHIVCSLAFDVPHRIALPSAEGIWGGNRLSLVFVALSPPPIFYSTIVAQLSRTKRTTFTFWQEIYCGAYAHHLEYCHHRYWQKFDSSSDH